MAVGLTDGTNNVPVDATSKGLVVQNPKVLAQAGFVNAAFQKDAGTVTGTPNNYSPLVTESRRLEVSPVTKLFADTFSYSAQDTARWSTTLTTFTQTFATGFVSLNGGAVTTASAVAVMQTYARYHVPTNGQLVASFDCLLTQAPQANNTVEFGFFEASGTTAPTDGVFFRYNASGVLQGILNYNGTETVVGPFTAPSANVVHSFEIYLDNHHVEFWIDGVQYADVSTQAADAQPMMALTTRPSFRIYNGATPPALAQVLKIGQVDVWITDEFTNKPYPHVQCAQGLMGYQGVQGMTVGTTAQFANNTNPATAVPTNTTAALGTGLGGRFQETLTLAAGTDGIISSYQVPAYAITGVGRKLIITGVTISGVVTVALTTNALAGVLGLNFGHTAVSLATAESATTKAPRRIALGITSISSVTAAAGTPVVTGPAIVFQSPIVVNPGEFVAVSHCKISTAPATGSVMWSITFDAHWE